MLTSRGSAAAGTDGQVFVYLATSGYWQAANPAPSKILGLSTPSTEYGYAVASATSTATGSRIW